MALGTPVAGAAAYSASGGTSVAPAYPSGITSTDELVLFVGQKPSTANGGTVTTPTGWTLRDSLTAAGGYGTTLGADTGNTNLYAYTKDTVTGSETGTLSVTLGTNGVSWAFIVRIPTGGGAISYGTADGQRTTTPTSPMSIALTNGASATNFQAGDKAIWAMCIPTDVTTPSQFSAESITATGATFATATELNEPDSATGNDIGGYSAYAHVDSGSSTTAPTVTATLAGTLTNVRGPVVLLRVREAQALTLDAQPGTFTLTGQDATLSRTTSFDAQPGSFALTGQDAELIYTPAATNIDFDAQPGSFSISGQDANLAVGRAINAQAGSFALTGQDATLLADGSINAEPGSFVITGQAATLTATKALSANAGSFTLTGQAATVATGRNLSAQAGSFSITGQDATLIYSSPNQFIDAQPGSFAITGQDATLARNYSFDAQPGAFTDAPYADPDYVAPGYVGGVDARLIVARILAASPASLGITGQDAELLYSAAPAGDGGGDGYGTSKSGKRPQRQSKMVYIEREGKILVFASAAQADAWVEANKPAAPTTKRAKKPKSIPKPQEVVDTRTLQAEFKIFQPAEDLQRLLAKNQLSRVLEIHNRIKMQQLQDDEDDIEVLLMMV